MKLSILFEDKHYGAYIIGSIFAFKRSRGNSWLSLFFGANQKSTQHNLSEKSFKDIIIRADSFYNKSYLKYFKNINYFLPNSNYVGIGMSIENDINVDIDFLILDKIKDKVFTINFLRGVIDSRSSADKTTDYIAMDIKKKNSVTTSAILIKSFESIFGENKQYNINPRFRSPNKKTRSKNPQFRIPYTVVFGKIGTFKIAFLEKIKKNESKPFKKLEKNTKIPKSFKNIIKWNTDNVKYTSRSNNENILEGDEIYLENYSKEKDKENFLYKKLRERFPTTIENKEAIKSINLSYEGIKKILEKTNGKDFLNPSYDIDENKLGMPLLDIHHILPRKYNHLLENKKDIDELDNLIPLRQDTHYLLHRGKFSEKKIRYLEILYKYIKDWLKKHNLEEITFQSFKNMY